MFFTGESSVAECLFVCGLVFLGYMYSKFRGTYIHTCLMRDTNSE